jgi:tape measure domain-containing protein
LNELGGAHMVNVNDAEIKKVQAEILRLRTEMRDAIRLDVTANTTEARAKIRALQATERELKKPVVIPVTTVGTAQAEGKLAGLNGQVTSMFPGVSKVTGGFKGMGVAAGGAAAAWGAFKATEIAGDLELLSVQLESVFGNGEQALTMLRGWATEAPFGLDATAGAARTLGLAGIDLKDMPKVLDDIGTAASLAGGNLDENLTGISMVVSQMLNKGHIMAEEMQQLAERQVPAWQALAASQGTSVAHVQELVRASKLGRADVIAFLDQLKADNPNAMSDAAETLTGKLSTLKDTFNQMAGNLGQVWLPGVKLAVGWLTDLTGAAGDAAGAVHDIVPIDPRAFGGIFGVIGLTHDLITGTDDAKDSTDKLKGSLDGADASAADTGGTVAGTLVPSLKDTRKAAADADQALQDLADGFSAVNQASSDLARWTT